MNLNLTTCNECGGYGSGDLPPQVYDDRVECTCMVVQPVPDEAKLTDSNLAKVHEGFWVDATPGKYDSIRWDTSPDRAVADAAAEKAWAYLLNMVGADRSMEGMELQAYLRGRFSEEKFIQTLVTEHDAEVAELQRRLDAHPTVDELWDIGVQRDTYREERDAAREAMNDNNVSK